MKQIKVVVPSFNSVDFLPKTLQSIENQTFKDYQVCVVDDGSTIPKQKEIILEFCKRNHWKFLFHEKNLHSLCSIIHGIEQLNCDDEDVIVLVDGDDWLAHERVFEKLHEIYTNNDLLLTWGQCEIYPQKQTPMKFAQAIPNMVIDRKLFREIPFAFWHLRSFKYKLWRNIKDQDLRDINGEYFKIQGDKAFLFPMLEMAGKKIRFIPETLYIYNIANPLNDFANTPSDEHSRVDLLIRSKPKYPVLE